MEGIKKMMPDDIERMADWLGRDDPAIQRLLRTAGRDPQMAQAVRDILWRRCRAAGIDPDNPPIFDPVHGLPEGQILLGHVAQGTGSVSCALSVGICREHVGIFGHTGTGKTFLAKHVVRDLAQQGCTLWLMDVEDEYGDLVSILGKDRVVAITPDQLRLNFFQPPGPWVAPASWLEEVNLLFRGATFLRDGSLNLFRTQMLKLFDASGATKGTQDYPCLTEATARFAGMGFGPNSRNRGFVDSLLNRFNMLLDTFPGTAGVAVSDMMTRLAGRNVIFRMHQLKGIPMQFLVGYLLAWLMRYRDGVAPQPIHVALIEEAHLQASAKERMDIGENILSRCFRLARKRGIALILCDQIPSELPPAIVGNLGCRVVMRLANPRDIWALQTSMGLDRDQALALSELQKRQAVVHYSLYPHAFMVQVPHMSFPPKPQEAELLASGEGILSESRWSETDSTLAHGKTIPSPGQAVSEDELVGDTRSVMVDICSEPGRTIEERCAVLKMDRAREFRARAALDARGTIEEVDQSLGGRVKLFHASPKGVEWAARRGIKVKTYKSGLVHEYILHQVEKAVGKLGPKWRMQRNSSIGKDKGLQPDLLILAPDDRRVIVEVCCNNMDYEAGNLAAEAVLPGVDGVLAVTPDGATRRALEQALAKGQQPDKSGTKIPITLLDAGRCFGEEFGWLDVLTRGKGNA